MKCWDCNEEMAPATRKETEQSAIQAFWVCQCGRFMPVLTVHDLGIWVASSAALAMVCQAPVELPSGVLDTAEATTDVPSTVQAMLEGVKLLAVP